MKNSDLAVRSELLKNLHCVIVKAGTRLLTDRASIAELVNGIAAVRERGCKVLLVTSGAVGVGMRSLGLAKRPRELAKVQALAAIGQSRLMAIYDEECRRHGFFPAQLLLTAADLHKRERYLNVMNCINSLWDDGVLPVVNENDSVSVDELKFGDNDTLAGMLGSLTGAELTVILTTEQGLRERDAEGKLAGRISVVRNLTDGIRAMAGGTDNSEFSIGGMSSKLRAADIVTSSGQYLWIADGREKGILDAIMRGDDVGTVFVPGPHRIPGRKRWITFFRRVSGRIVVDDGAARALRERGKSLLPSGAVGAEGDFRRGDAVEVADASGAVFARGLVNFDADECRKTLGCRSAELHTILGADADEELIHRDNLTLL
ncbi:MAG: glutamate 5-kinase [Victivallaceae bacterium]|nr:glutamate 5-kinase [Victivallaceae bacterium]